MLWIKKNCGPFCFLLLKLIHASDLTCNSGDRRQLRVKTGEPATDYILPVIYLLAGFVNVSRCRWKIFSHDSAGPAKRVTLQGVHPERVRKLSANLMKAKISIHLPEPYDGAMCTKTSNGTNLIDLHEGMLLDVSLPPGSYMSVYVSQSATQSEVQPVALMVQSAQTGSCPNSDAVGLPDRCFIKSTAKASLYEQLRSSSTTGGSIQLAGFQSLRELAGFARETRDRLTLSLTESVRIGMFYNREAGRLAFLGIEKQRCLLLPVNDSTEILSLISGSPDDRQCISLSIDDNSEDQHLHLKFVNCSAPMPGLFSFAKFPALDKFCGDCTVAVKLLLVPMSNYPSANDSILLIAVILLILVAAVLFTVIFVLICYFEKFRRPNYSRSPSSE